MPIYEFRCEACGERFDRLVRSVDQMPVGIACPACQSGEVRRLISAPAVHTGGSAGESTGTEETPPEKPPVFGRKELNEVLRSRK